MRVLVTGADGFVGSAVVRALAAAGCTVRGLRRRADRSPDGTCQWVTGDLLDPALDLAALCAGCDAVVHLAARTHVLGRRSGDRVLEQYRAINVTASGRLAAAAAAQGAVRFVFMSSIKVNGERTGRTAHGQWLRFSGADAPRPEDAYGISKWEAEQQLARQLGGSATELVCLRPPLVYGLGARGNLRLLIRLLARHVPLPLAGIDNLRSMIWVDNLASAVLRCLAQLPRSPLTLTLADVDISTPDLIRAVADAAGTRAHLFRCPAPVLARIGRVCGMGNAVRRLVDSLVVDRQQAEQLLGWQPRQEFHAALRAMVRAQLGRTG